MGSPFAPIERPRLRGVTLDVVRAAPLADAPLRIVLRVLEVAILTGLLTLVGLVADRQIGSSGLAMLLAIDFVLEPALRRAFGGSPIELLAGYAVVRADRDGRVSWGQAIRRWRCSSAGGPFRTA